MNRVKVQNNGWKTKEWRQMNVDTKTKIDIRLKVQFVNGMHDNDVITEIMRELPIKKYI